MILDDLIDEYGSLKKSMQHYIAENQKLKVKNKQLSEQLHNSNEALESCINMLEKEQLHTIRKDIIKVHQIPEERV